MADAGAAVSAASGAEVVVCSGECVDAVVVFPAVVLWALVVLLIIFALVGGAAVSNWLFLILLIAVILALVGYF